MERTDHSGKSEFAVVAASVLAAFCFMASTASAFQGETFDITCYLGNPADNNNVGSITILNPQSAGESCNQTFSVCNGQCSGCYADADLTEDVCFDGNGNRFLRPM